MTSSMPSCVPTMPTWMTSGTSLRGHGSVKEKPVLRMFEFLAVAEFQQRLFDEVRLDGHSPSSPSSSGSGSSDVAEFVVERCARNNVALFILLARQRRVGGVVGNRHVGKERPG